MNGNDAVIDKFVENVYKTTDLDVAIMSTNENMIDCDLYYTIPVNIWGIIKTNL